MLGSLAGYAAGVATALLTLALAVDPNLLLNIGTLAVVIGGAWAVYRHGTAVMLRQANADLRVHAQEQDAKVRNLTQEVALLRQKTDLEPIAAAVVTQFESHERRAQQRHDASLRIMDLIARRLGPDPNGEEM